MIPDTNTDPNKKYNTQNSILVYTEAVAPNIPPIKLPLTIALPKRVLMIVDPTTDWAQLSLFCDDRQALRPWQEYINRQWSEEKPVRLTNLAITLTNDPYTQYAFGVVNLGYYCLRLRVCHGVLFDSYPITYTTHDINDIMHMTNIPLRPVTAKYSESEQLFDGFLNFNHKRVYFLDYRFPCEPDKGIILCHSEWDTDSMTGFTRVMQADMKSAFNRVRTQKYVSHTTLADVYKFHGIEEQNIPADEIKKFYEDQKINNDKNK